MGAAEDAVRAATPHRCWVNSRGRIDGRHPTSAFALDPNNEQGGDLECLNNGRIWPVAGRSW